MKLQLERPRRARECDSSHSAAFASQSGITNKGGDAHTPRSPHGVPPVDDANSDHDGLVHAVRPRAALAERQKITVFAAARGP